MKSAYLNVCTQLLQRDFKLTVEGELEQIVEDGRGHMVQLDEALWGLFHSGLGQGPKVLTALWKPPEVHLKGTDRPKRKNSYYLLLACVWIVVSLPAKHMWIFTVKTGSPKEQTNKQTKKQTNIYLRMLWHIGWKWIFHLKKNVIWGSGIFWDGKMKCIIVLLSSTSVPSTGFEETAAPCIAFRNVCWLRNITYWNWGEMALQRLSAQWSRLVLV